MFIRTDRFDAHIAVVASVVAVVWEGSRVKLGMSTFEPSPNSDVGFDAAS